jgi:hypothetical protein
LITIINKADDPEALKEFFASAETKGQQRIMIRKRKESKKDKAEQLIKYSISKVLL